MTKKKTRLFFDYTRTAMVTENGVVAIDVDDPTDDDEVSNALRTMEYTYFQCLEREYDEDSDNWAWSEWDYDGGDGGERVVSLA